MSDEYIAGSVLSVLRYPVKSMMGEELTAADVMEGGLVGDRAYALIDNSTGKIASAKNPRKWARLFDCHASFVEPPRKGHPMPPVWIMLPDGSNITSDQPNAQHNERSAQREYGSFTLLRARGHAGQNGS